MYILMDRISGMLLEFPEQMIFADIEPDSQRFQLQFLLQVFVDVIDDITDLVIVNNIQLDILIMAVQICPVKINQQLCQICLLQYPAAEAVAENRIFQPGYDVLYHYIELRSGPQYIVIAHSRTLKAHRQVGVLPKTSDIVGVYPENIAFIRLPRLYHRLVELTVVYQHYVSGPYPVRFAFDDVSHVSGKDNKNLIKEVVMILYFHRAFILVVEEFKIPADHILTVCKFLFDGLHCIILLRT